jgi:hypothetical protein
MRDLTSSAFSHNDSPSTQPLPTPLAKNGLRVDPPVINKVQESKELGMFAAAPL